MDLREKLTPLGWVQGSLIAGSSLGEAFTHDFYLIVSQTCDILQSKVEVEPSVELLGLTEISGDKMIEELKNGRNPREIHFEIYMDGIARWVHASVHEICHLDRSLLVGREPEKRVSIGKNALADLIRWRADRYLRPAFPDDFDRLLKHRKNHSKLKKWITAEKQLIGEIRVLIDPFCELPEGESYVIDFLLIIDPKVFIDPTFREKLQTLCKKIEECYEEAPDLSELTCRFLPMDRVTLYEVRNYLRWSPHDHLSFGE